MTQIPTLFCLLCPYNSGQNIWPELLFRLKGWSLKSCASSVTFLILFIFLVLNATLCTAQVEQSAQAQLRSAQSSTTAKMNTAAAGSFTAASTAAPAAKSVALPRGTTLLAELSGSLKAKKLKPGDKVKAVLVQDVVAGGKVVAKSESKLVGRVIEVKARDAQNLLSRLGVVFDRILLKHHQELEIEAVIQALAPPVVRRSRVDEPDQMLPPPMLSPVSNVGNMANGRGTSSASGGGRSTGGTAALANSAGDLGAVTTVQSTPGSNPGNSVSSVRAAVSATQPMTGGAGVHGVYGLKNLSLIPSTSQAGSPVIVSAKSDVKLDSGTQLVLVVIGR